MNCSQLEMNEAMNLTVSDGELSADSAEYWPIPLISCLILAGIFGNCLVCLAISTNKELQNMTNHFLMSLAVADLLVSMVVMPFGAMVIFNGGSWPLSELWCIFYQTCDVLACSVSILHLMFISIGRYRGISKPLAQRQESERAVLGRIVLTWGLGLVLASPIPVLAVVDIEHVMAAHDRCEVKNRHFRLLGSLFSFYIPMLIMVTTYILTVHQLSRKKNQALTSSRHVVT
ncbi:5-hydroxytryptamine receptor 2C, partial [Eurytemora carolleeae]|uniref:5-hydroxytryptamine receptor 2C n=1 Tax=Eurytemora carolleeae TaxID=1294199 RepID=UPI000C75C931